MTRKEFKKKWGNISPDAMTDKQFVEFKEDCFSMYEEVGFTTRFNSPYDDYLWHNGMTFKVLRRATTNECDLEALPIWLVEFENGDTAYCYPEEICKAEQKCPYCESKNLEIAEDGLYHCKDCDRLFNDEDITREDLRHKISCLLNGTSEEKPAEIFFNLPSAEEEAQGLSSLEIPAIEKIFEMEGEGTMWYHISGEREDNGEDTWHDIDELPIKDMKGLLLFLRENS